MTNLSDIPLVDLLAELDRRTADLRVHAALQERRAGDAERQRRSRANRATAGAQTPLLSQRARPNVTASVTEKPVTSEGKVTSASQEGQADVTNEPAAQPQVPPSPPSSPAPPRPSAPARGQPPTVEQVIGAMASMGLPIPIAERGEVAQAYIDARTRIDPAWHTPATHLKPAQPIDLRNWQPDLRIFCRSWRGIEQERAARQGNNGHSKPRAEPDTTPLAVNPILWRRFVTDPEYSRYRSLADQPTPTTETHIARSVIDDWKTFKRSHRTS